MSTQTNNTYHPIDGVENDYKLKPSTRANEKAIHEIVVRYPGQDIDERQMICRTEGWDPESRIPEISQQPRIQVSALGAMLDRLKDQPDQLAAELEQLVERFAKKDPLEPIGSDQYWEGLARALFVGLPEDVDPGTLDFKEIRRAYNDFFTL